MKKVINSFIKRSLLSRNIGTQSSGVGKDKVNYHLTHVDPPFQASKNIPEHFSKINEADVMHEMIDGFHADWKTASQSDILIVGSGLTGLVAAYYLSKVEGLKVTIVDKLSHPGGAFSSGAQFFNKVVIRKPAQHLLFELGIPFIEKDDYVTVKNPSSLISALLNNTLNHSKSEFVFLGNLDVRDYLFRGSECVGVSCSFLTATEKDAQASPFPFFASTVISACGSRSSFTRLRNLGWVDPYYSYSAESMDMNASEDAIVHHTRLVAPSLVMGGVEVAYLDGLNVPGPTSGCLIQSGWKASSLALESLNESRDRKNLKRIGLETASYFIGSRV